MLRKPGRNNPFRLIYKNYLRLKGTVKSQLSSNVIIDILIPVIEKDLSTLPLVIICARKNIINPIGNIYVVGNKGVIEDFCQKFACIFLDENVVLPIKKSDILFNDQEWFRAGWIFQQLIKLSADDLVENDNVLIIDADTCLTTRQAFVLNDYQMILNFSDEYHFAYSSYSKLLQLNKRFFLSFVCHHMVFNKTILKQIKKEIELHTGKNWIDAIISTIDFNVYSGFSEYELYGNYVYYNYPNKVHLEYWFNKSLKNDVLDLKMIESYTDTFKSISFHG